MWRDAHACRGTRTPRVTVEEKQGAVREYSLGKLTLGCTQYQEEGYRIIRMNSRHLACGCEAQ